MSSRLKWAYPQHNTPDWETCPCTYCICERLYNPSVGLVYDFQLKYEKRFGRQAPFPLCDELASSYIQQNYPLLWWEQVDD